MLNRLDEDSFNAELKANKLLIREHTTTKIDHGRFAIGDKKFTKQYAQLYFSRLAEMSGRMKAKAKTRWPDIEMAEKLLTIPEEQCILVGTLYKEMKLKPNALDEYTKSRSDKPVETPDILCSEDDSMVLEDSHARIPLSFAGKGLPAISSLVSGIVVAVKGKNNSKSGVFLVDEIMYAGIPSQKQEGPTPASDKFIVLASGLRIGGKSSDTRLQMLTSFINGMAGTATDQQKSSEIAQVVLAGNSIIIEKEGNPEYAHFNKKAENDKRVGESITSALRDFDVTLTSIASNVNVLLMPGAEDPSNFNLPQQKLPKFLFRSSATYSTLECVTNPCQAEISNRKILGTSGQNIADLAKYSTAKEPIDFLERTLTWQHLAPTAPDTLGCYAFTDRDPFLINECPDIYFAGNQEKFASKIVEGPEGQKACLVMVPDFSKTGSIAMVNLRNLESYEVEFGL